MRLTIIALCALLTGCSGNVKPAKPAATIIEVPVRVYVPIEGKLLERCPWPKTGKPSEAIEVAKKRGQCLERYEIQLDGIGLIQGRAVP